jgi:hypothetical protein
MTPISGQQQETTAGLLSADYRRFAQIPETTENVRAAEKAIPLSLLQPLICDNLRQSADNIFLLSSVSSSTPHLRNLRMNSISQSLALTTMRVRSSR